MNWLNRVRRHILRPSLDELIERAREAVQAEEFLALSQNMLSTSAKAQQAVAAPFGLADPSLYGFRRLTGRENQAALRDLPLPTHERMQDIAYWLYLANPMAQWFTNMQAAYVAGDGASLSSKDEQVQEVLDAFWEDSSNAWEASLEDYVRELSLYGEQCWPVFVSPGTGLVRLGYLDPCLIEEVVIDPENAKQAIGVVTKDNYQGIRTGQRRYKTALLIPEDELTPAAQEERRKFGDGACFYFAVNKVSNGSRGWSDLLCKADWLDGYEQFLFQRLERSDLGNRVVSDVTMTGATPEQIDAYMKTFQLPPPGGHFIHNEKIELEMKAPNMNASDAEHDARMFKHQAISPAPEHWYGGGGDVNRATAGEMDESTYKVFKQRQNKVKAFIKTVARYQIQQAKQVGALPQTAEERFDVQMPEMVKADLTKLSGSAQATSNSIGSMLTQGLINKEEGRKIYAVAIKPMGIELEDKKNDELEAEAAERDLNDASADYRQPGDKANDRQGSPAGMKKPPESNNAKQGYPEFNPDQPRDKSGEWTDSGAQGSSESSALINTWVRANSASEEFSRVKATGERWAEGAKDAQWTALYEETQRKLEQQGYADTTPLYRGIRVPAEHPLARAIATGRIKPGDVISAEGMTLVSWSERESVAQRFASATGNESGIVLERVVHRKDIVAGHRTQRGFFSNEDEMIVRNTEGPLSLKVRAALIQGRVYQADSGDTAFDLRNTDGQRGIGHA